MRDQERLRPAQHPVHGQVDVGLLAQRLVPGRGRRARPSHRPAGQHLIVCRATPRSAPRAASASKSRRSARPASARSCRAAAPSRSRSARGCAGASPAPQPVAGDADEADEPLVARLDRGLERAVRRRAPCPTRSASTRLCSWMRSIRSTPSRSSERWSCSRAPGAALARLGRQEERGRGGARSHGADAAARRRRSSPRRRCGLTPCSSSASRARSASWRTAALHVRAPRAEITGAGRRAPSSRRTASARSSRRAGGDGRDVRRRTSVTSLRPESAVTATSPVDVGLRGRRARDRDAHEPATLPGGRRPASTRRRPARPRRCGRCGHRRRSATRTWLSTTSLTTSTPRPARARRRTGGRGRSTGRRGRRRRCARAGGGRPDGEPPRTARRSARRSAGRRADTPGRSGRRR